VWLRLGVEGVLIVLSILAAFAIDAWWDARADHRARQQILLNLKQDFEQNLVIVDTAYARHGRIKAAARELLGQMGPRGSREFTDDSIASLLQRVMDRERLQPVQGSLTSLLNSGQWDLLENDALQSALAEWPTHVARVNSREDQAIEGINNRLIPRIHSLVPIRDIDMVMPQFREVGPSRFPMDYDLLLSDMVFEGAVDERWWDEDSILANLERVRESIERILELIESELVG
jgi:hypothetical protein